jgi:hypothetical protein
MIRIPTRSFSEAFRHSGTRAGAGYWAGWMLFDFEHVDESENTASKRPDNWRATAWEIHPVADICILN